MSFPKLFIDAQATDVPRVRRALQKIQAWANSLVDSGGGGAAESEVPNIYIESPSGYDLEFRGTEADGEQGIVTSQDYTWNTNKYPKLMIALSEIDDILVIHKSSTDVAVSGSTGAWVVTIPNNHIILDATTGDLGGLTNSVDLQTVDLTKKRTIPPSPTRYTAWLAAAPVSPDVGTFNVLTGWAALTPKDRYILASSLSSAGLIDGDGWARFKCTHITVGTGKCRFSSYGAR